MRETTYTDEAGRKTYVLLPDDAPDSHAPYGIRVGPPSLEGLELPEEIEIRLHNLLYARRILTVRDARSRRNEVLSAIQASLHSTLQNVLALYDKSERVEQEAEQPSIQDRKREQDEQREEEERKKQLEIERQEEARQKSLTKKKLTRRRERRVQAS